MELIDFPYERDERFYAEIDMHDLSEQDRAHLMLKVAIDANFINYRKSQLELQYFDYLKQIENFETLRYDDNINDLYIIKDNILFFNSVKFHSLAEELFRLKENLRILNSIVSKNFSKDIVRMLIEQMFYDASLHSGYTVTYKLMYDDIVTMHCIIHKDLKLYDVYITKGSLSKMLSERNDRIVDYISKNIEQLGFRKPSNDDETNLIYKKFNTSKREMTFE